MKQQKVVGLINCVTTHNFIAKSLVDSLKLPLIDLAHYGYRNNGRGKKSAKP